MDTHNKFVPVKQNSFTERIISPSLKQKELRMMIGLHKQIIKSKIEDEPQKYGFSQAKQIPSQVQQKLPILDTKVQDFEEVLILKHRKNKTFQQERLNDLCQNLLNENKYRKLFGYDTDIQLSEGLPKLKEKKPVMTKKSQLTIYLQSKDTRFMESPTRNKVLRRQNLLPSISSVGLSNSVETREESPFKTPDKMNFEASVNHINENYSGLWDQMLDKNLSKSKIDFFQKKLRSPSKRLVLAENTRKSKYFQFFERLKAANEYGLEDIVFYQNQVKQIYTVE